MEKLADALQKLEEDDLLKVVQMVHDHKTNETYVKNDVEREEFPGASGGHGLIFDGYCRGRVPCRPVHAPRTPRQDAMEVCSRLWGRQRSIMNRKNGVSVRAFMILFFFPDTARALLPPQPSSSRF